MDFDGTGRNATKTIKLTERTKGRLDAHNRDSETLGGTIDRALDALEREGELPDAVRAALKYNRYDHFAAFKAGFNQSAEGFNGEFAPNGADVDEWLQDRYEEWAEED